jgi:hypothetical protein
MRCLNLLNVFAVGKVLRCDIATLFGRFKRVDCLDICDDDEDAAGKDQYKRHDAQEADSIESKENILKPSQSIRPRYKHKLYSHARAPTIVIDVKDC